MCVEYIYIYLVFEAGTVKLWLCLVKISRHGGVFVCPIASNGDIAAIPQQRKTETVGLFAPPVEN